MQSALKFSVKLFTGECFAIIYVKLLAKTKDSRKRGDTCGLWHYICIKLPGKTNHIQFMNAKIMTLPFIIMYDLNMLKLASQLASYLNNNPPKRLTVSLDVQKHGGVLGGTGGKQPCSGYTWRAISNAVFNLQHSWLDQQGIASSYFAGA